MTTNYKGMSITESARFGKVFIGGETADGRVFLGEARTVEEARAKVDETVAYVEAQGTTFSEG